VGLRSRHVSTRRHVTRHRIVRKAVRHHNHRRFAGVRHLNPNRKIRVSKTGRHHRFLGRKKSTTPRRPKGTAPVRVLKGRHGPRKFLGRKKSAVKRVMKKGAKRTFKGRKKVTMRVGLKRTFKGRKKVLHRKKPVYTHPRKRPTKKLKQAARGPVISAQSYINMF
jgi:hypothetical protein